MQPIDPPIGGGRLRLLGLYHALGEEIKALYVGTYDWRGPGYRRHYLTPTLEEIDVPLSERHFMAAAQKQQLVGGKTVIDSTFHELAHLSPEYVATARAAVANAAVVVFSHPWVYPLVSDLIDRQRQLVIYDSQNVEGVLRATLLDDGAEGTNIVRGVVAAEYAICQASDLILACSSKDRELFSRLYDIPIDKIRLVPNGVFTERIRPADGETKRISRLRLGLDERPTAIFLGSKYQPNVEAAVFIADELAPRLPAVQFVIAGGVGEGLAEAVRSSNNPVRVTGYIDDTEKFAWLAAVDLAINPMFSGSGTNIKMFDFMAAGLPVVTTPVGARGIETGEPVFQICERESFLGGLKTLLDSWDLRSRMAELGRHYAERYFSWERISPHLGHMLTRHYKRKGQRPFFSVVIPTYERHALLTRLIDRLAMQSFANFEVIIVDQSNSVWPERHLDFGIDVHYVHTDIKGAANARNMGANLGCGEVIAFTDDDCDPSSGWLAAARPYFDDPAVVGIEGLIRSVLLADPAWRAVTNEGFTGIGFMTANFFIRTTTFNAINGFDLAFDGSPFREDTDLGWRAQRLGRIPFSCDAWVFHPPHRRTDERESLAQRNGFFEKDALLLKKHPDQYEELFLRECHWMNTPGFWPHFLAGARKYQVTLPDYVKVRLAEAQASGHQLGLDPDQPPFSDNTSK